MCRITGFAGEPTLCHCHAAHTRALLLARPPPMLVDAPPSMTLGVDRAMPRRRQVHDPNHNPRSRAPEHVQIVNNLTAADHSQHARETHLSTMQPKDWDHLASHMQHCAAPLTRCCFQCGMLNHPAPGDTIAVTNVRRKRDCRAYRVFRHYIRNLSSHEEERLHACTPHAAAAEITSAAKASVFLCEPTANGDACKVYACSHCKRACRRRDANGKLFYAQCSAAEPPRLGY